MLKSFPGGMILRLMTLLLHLHLSNIGLHEAYLIEMKAYGEGGLFRQINFQYFMLVIQATQMILLKLEKL